MNRRAALIFGGTAALSWAARPALSSAPATADTAAMLRNWYRLVLKLVRHTPTYSPPVASRSFAYLGVIAYEAVASGSDTLISLAGQLNGLNPLPPRLPGEAYSDAMVVHAALASGVRTFFGNTGPTGQRVLDAVEAKRRDEAAAGIAADIAARSEAYGRAVADHVFSWSQPDGGASVENMGFPMNYELTKGPAHWVPTSLIAQQQAPLLPVWGNNRSFAMPDSKTCGLHPPPAYSKDPSSAFYKEALEVYETVNALTEEQEIIARFWSDDPMLSPTPPGHWVTIMLDVLEEQKADADRSAEALARMGVTLADAFIACWHSKFEYDLLRPVTYIKRVIDPKWEALLITPPFPEYPSGHSTQSGAAATVLTAMFGENHAFSDSTHVREGLAPRPFPSFWAAAEEAGISRLYGGIHFRAAIERGLEQGRCVGSHAVALRTRSMT
ncbi:vanadium-dependent haloperoxidase [Aestuariivirga sp.]|uniref:vanadium-dependent haloperoxidase n=1 Tax=Aestuariivirga sp. TaxID=2650926 RepID=UPI00359372CA